MSATRTIDLPSPYVLRRGGQLVGARLAYETWGELAADRGNARVAERYDPISAPVARALRLIARKGREHRKPVTLCGELASKPIGALTLVALGYRSLSLTPSEVGPVKSMLLELDAEKALAAIGPLLDHSETGMTLRQRIEQFAASENLQL